MDLRQAEKLAEEIIGQLNPYCERITVAGSIRRKRAWPKDIDLLLIPGNQGQLAMALQSLGEPRYGGQKIEQRVYKGVQVDLYFATPQTWATLLLIRTGSKAHNIKLAGMAKVWGWSLRANGGGLLNEQGERIAGDTEASFFECLGLPYAEPWERD